MNCGKIFFVLFKTAIFTAVVPFTVGWWLPTRIHRASEVSANVPSGGFAPQVLSYILLLLGAAVYLWCAWDFSVKGLGTPAPIDAPKNLVVNGLYRYVRNPMYLGVFSIVASRALYFWSLPVLFYFVVAAAGAVLFVHFYEEPHLRKIFGEQYVDYRRRVPGWLPRFSAIRTDR
jgi:protein-S-isoprenylcysteine O-methyltransferase Ste14